MNPVPANETTSLRLIRAMRENWLADFARENALTIDHFLAPLVDNLWTPLHYGVLSGRLGEIKEILKPSGALFSSHHFLTKDRNGSSPLSLAAVRGNLAEIFVPGYWSGRVGQMEKLWKQVPVRHRDDIDYPALRAEAIILSVRAGMKIPLADLWGARRSWAACFRKETPSLGQEHA